MRIADTIATAVNTAPVAIMMAKEVQERDERGGTRLLLFVILARVPLCEVQRYR